MPDVGATADEGVLASWLVEESARFDAAQTIAYVETQDELVSVEAGRPGILLRALVTAGTRVAPGTPIGVLGEVWEQVHDLEAVLVELGVAPQHRSMATSGAARAEASAPPTHALGSDRPPSPFAVPDPLSVVAEEQMVEVAEADPTGSQHLYLRVLVRADRLVSLSADLEREGTPESTVMDLVARAVAGAHRQVPQVGVARLELDRTATPGIPVTHPGRFGVAEAAAVVPQSEAAVLAVGSVRDEPVVDGTAVVAGKVITLTLSVRPGRVDDAPAARWLAVLVALLERPEWMVE